MNVIAIVFGLMKVCAAMWWKRLVILNSALMLVFLAADTLRSQSQIRARVDLVVVPVTVRDGNGFLVPGLEKDDFSVFEDGKQQTIVNFSKDTLPLSAAIVIDDGIIGPALKRLIPVLPSVAAGFSADDEMTSFRYDHLVWRLSDFTRDQQQITKSFRELAQIADSRPIEPEQPSIYDKVEDKNPRLIKKILRLWGFGKRGGASAGSRTEPAPNTPSATRTMHSAVYEAAIALQNRAEGNRKIILLFSDGVVFEPEIGLLPGKHLHTFDRNVEILLRNQIQVYSIYTLGSLLETTRSDLNSYARATGGDVYGGRSESDMKFAFNRIAEQARTQYVLGYISTNTAPPQGVYRKIEVKSGDRDQKRKLVHRQGYTQYPIPR